MSTQARPRRPFGLALLAAAAGGVLLQLGPAHASSAQARRSTATTTKQQALAAYGRPPLAFTANAGQTDTRVRRARSRRVGRVIRQRPRAGAVRRRGFPVNLVVGRR